MFGLIFLQRGIASKYFPQFFNISIEESKRYRCAIYTPITQIKNCIKTSNIAYNTHTCTHTNIYKILTHLSRKIVRSNIYLREHHRGISRWSNLHRTSGRKSFPLVSPGKREPFQYRLQSSIRSCKTRQEKIPAKKERGNVAFFFQPSFGLHERKGNPSTGLSSSASSSSPIPIGTKSNKKVYPSLVSRFLTRPLHISTREISVSQDDRSISVPDNQLWLQQRRSLRGHGEGWQHDEFPPGARGEAVGLGTVHL